MAFRLYASAVLYFRSPQEHGVESDVVTANTAAEAEEKAIEAFADRNPTRCGKGWELKVHATEIPLELMRQTLSQ